LKEGARAIFGLNDAQLYGDQKEVVDPRWGTTPRDILQRLGTEAIRGVFWDDHWIRRTLSEVDARGQDKYVVTDVRFMNEVRAIRERGGHVVRLTRPDAPGIATSRHASEALTGSEADWHLLNGGSIPDLHRRVETLLDEVDLFDETYVQRAR
jgi:hypothetical protein